MAQDHVMMHGLSWCMIAVEYMLTGFQMFPRRVHALKIRWVCLHVLPKACSHVFQARAVVFCGSLLAPSSILCRAELIVEQQHDTDLRHAPNQHDGGINEQLLAINKAVKAFAVRSLKFLRSGSCKIRSPLPWSAITLITYCLPTS